MGGVGWVKTPGEGSMYWSNISYGEWFTITVVVVPCPWSEKGLKVLWSLSGPQYSRALEPISDSVDVTLAYKDEGLIQAHQVILAASSLYQDGPAEIQLPPGLPGGVCGHLLGGGHRLPQPHHQRRPHLPSWRKPVKRPPRKNASLAALYV